MSYNKAVEDFRDEEYPMMKGKVYLDHGGTTIYAKSLIEAFSSKMVNGLYGNPHSASDPAKLSGDAVDSIRERALRFFKADPEHFDLVFTGNASAAIKLVGESFRDLAVASSVSGSFWYGFHKDAHNSVVGVREYADGNQYCFTSDEEVEQWLSGYASHINSSADGALPGLFAYPGQSNMTGRRMPLSWTAQLRNSSKAQHQNTYSLLDAAALATTTPLDLSNPDTAPDFTALSFYKIFGFPDLGALIIRKKSGHILSWRKYFGGGTVDGVTVLHEATVRRRDAALHEGLEDGTLPFHSIVALGCALDVHKKLYGSMKTISRHTLYLGHRLYTKLSNLTHYNGRPVCVIYNDGVDVHPYTDPTKQGSTVAFNIVRTDGTFVPYTTVEEMANEKKVYLRAGGLCNPGGIASLLKVEPWQFKRAYSAGFKCGDTNLEIINGKPLGVVRASLGAMSVLHDVDTLIDFISDNLVEHPGANLMPSKLQLPHHPHARNDVQDGKHRASHSATDLNAEGRMISSPPRLPVSARQIQHRLHSARSEIQLSSNGSYDFNAESHVVPSGSRIPLLPRENEQHRSFDSRDGSFDFNSDGRMPALPSHSRPQASIMSSKTDNAPALRQKRSFFSRKSSDSHRNHTNDASAISGRTLTAEDVELTRMIEQNSTMGAGRKNSKASSRFWKGSTGSTSKSGLTESR